MASLIMGKKEKVDSWVQNTADLKSSLVDAQNQVISDIMHHLHKMDKNIFQTFAISPDQIQELINKQKNAEYQPPSSADPLVKQMFVAMQTCSDFTRKAKLKTALNRYKGLSGLAKPLANQLINMRHVEQVMNMYNRDRQVLWQGTTILSAFLNLVMKLINVDKTRSADTGRQLYASHSPAGLFGAAARYSVLSRVDEKMAQLKKHDYFLDNPIKMG